MALPRILLLWTLCHSLGRGQPLVCEADARPGARDRFQHESEGTWMSVDISPDGIVFELLAHIFRVPALQAGWSGPPPLPRLSKDVGRQNRFINQLFDLAA
jgi:hypothetical protein